MKKFLTKIVVPTMLLALALSSSAQGLGSEDTSFRDVSKSHPNYDGIEYLKNHKIVEGYEDGTFGPEKTINRAEFMKIVVPLMDYSDSSDWAGKENGSACGESLKIGEKYAAFTDVESDKWFSNYICAAKAHGLVKGYPDGTFKPSSTISFAEASKVLLAIFHYKEAEDGNVWYSNYMRRLDGLRSIPPTVKGPHAPITRGEMAEIIWRLANGKMDEPTRTFKDIDPSNAPKSSQTTEEIGKSTDSDFPTIASCEELSTRVGRFQPREKGGGGGFGAMPFAAVSEESKAADSSSSGDFSKTNVQVKGVDEGDVIKNDGQYIYTVRGNTVRIVKAAPVENMVELSKLTFKDENFGPSELYLEGNKLVIIGYSWIDTPAMEGFNEIMPYQYGSSRTKVYVVDITDRSNPKKIREISLEGDANSSRRIGDYLYVVLNQAPYFSYGQPAPFDQQYIVPRINDVVGGGEAASIGSPMVNCNDIHYFPGYEEPQYLIVAGIPLNNVNQKVETEVMLGASSNIYSSLKNLYVAAIDYGYNYGPAIPLPAVLDSSMGDVVENKIQPVQEKTKIFKFALDKGKVDFTGKGSVPGRILDQFSMDEYDDHFRIATTTGYSWDEDRPSGNHLYVLDNNLKIVGKIENIAPGESIYSTRFVGDRGYMVTFQKVDPLFVIDLANHDNPKILGKLKIPGYSDYLHPYDRNHVIGFGKDAVDAGKDKDFAWYQGMKVALFDISNVEEPKEKFSMVIGDRGTDSDLLWDHKALLFDKDKKLLAFPIRVAELTEEQKKDNEGNAYGSTVFDGAYVYTIDLNKGFELRGKITHYDDPDVFKKSGEYFYGEYGKAIKRVIYIGDYLYSISDGMIKGLTMDDVEEVNRVELQD